MFGAHPAQNFEAIHAGQADVEHDQVERRFLCFAEGGFAVMDHEGIVTGLGESGGDMAGEPDFIVYHEDAHDIWVDATRAKLSSLRHLSLWTLNGSSEQPKVTAMLPFQGRREEGSGREKVDRVQRGDNLTTDQQFLQIVALA